MAGEVNPTPENQPQSQPEGLSEEYWKADLKNGIGFGEALGGLALMNITLPMRGWEGYVLNLGPTFLLLDGGRRIISGFGGMFKHGFHRGDRGGEE